MSVLQAALIALCYAFARSAFTAGLGDIVLAQPLVAGAITGLLLGAPLEGAALGGALNLATLGLSQARLRAGPDVALVGYVGVPLMLLSGLRLGDADSATFLLALVAIGILLNFLRALFNSVLAHWVDFFGERGDTFTTAFAGVMPAQLWAFVVAFLPAFFLLRLEPATVLNLARALPVWVQNALVLAQHLLGLLGIAMTLRVVLQGSSVAYFVLGWLVASAAAVASEQSTALTHAGVPLLVTLIGASIATIHAYTARRTAAANPEFAREQVAAAAEIAGGPRDGPALSRADLLSAFAWWLFFHDAAVNFERSQNMGFAGAMSVIISRLYGAVEDRAAAMRRHLALFASEPAFGAFAVGASAALEQKRAHGEPVSEIEFVGAKASAMATLSALGDAVMRGVSLTFLVAVGAWLAAQNSLLGPFVFVVAQSAVFLAVAYGMFQLGYVQLNRWLPWARANEWLRAGLFGATRLGAFVLGALIVSVTRATPVPVAPVVQIGAAAIPLQGLFDAILPGAIPLAITAGMWYLMRYRGVQPMTLLGACVIAALAVGGLLRVLRWL